MISSTDQIEIFYSFEIEESIPTIQLIKTQTFDAVHVHAFKEHLKR